MAPASTRTPVARSTPANEVTAASRTAAAPPISASSPRIAACPRTAPSRTPRRRIRAAAARTDSAGIRRVQPTCGDWLDAKTPARVRFRRFVEISSHPCRHCCQCIHCLQCLHHAPADHSRHRRRIQAGAARAPPKTAGRWKAKCARSCARPCPCPRRSRSITGRSRKSSPKNVAAAAPRTPPPALPSGSRLPP